MFLVGFSATPSLLQQFVLPFDLTLDLNDMSAHMTWPNVPDCAVTVAALKTGARITTDTGIMPGPLHDFYTF